MNEFVLDASAVLAVLNQEPGEATVLPLMESSVICTVNIAEVATVLIDRGNPPELVVELLSDFPYTAVPFSDELALASAKLRPSTRHKGLSLGDRACLALALQANRPVITGDRAWQDLEVGVEIKLFR